MSWRNKFSVEILLDVQYTWSVLYTLEDANFYFIQMFVIINSFFMSIILHIYKKCMLTTLVLITQKYNVIIILFQWNFAISVLQLFDS